MRVGKMAGTGAKAVPARNPRQERRNQLPTGVEGKFYMDIFVTSTRYALRGAPTVSGWAFR